MEEELENPSNGEGDELDSTCTTPYVSAPSSPGRGPAALAAADGGGGGGYFFSAPASPTRFVFENFAPSTVSTAPATAESSVAVSFEFESFGRGSMISADEIFLNGKIRPMKLSSHLQRPQSLVPLLDLEEDEEEGRREGKVNEETVARGRDLRLRSGSIHRRARSMSPLRNMRFQWQEEGEAQTNAREDEVLDLKKLVQAPAVDLSTASASSSRSSSGRNSKRWIFLKDLLYRSKSEGSANGKEKEKDKFWISLSFSSSSSSKDKLKPSNAPPAPQTSTPTSTSRSSASSPAISKKSEVLRPVHGGCGGRRRGGPSPSPHERLYTLNRAQAEEMRRRTFLPYRPGLLGCLGFTSRGYGAMNGLARTINPVSSR